MGTTNTPATSVDSQSAEPLTPAPQMKPVKKRSRKKLILGIGIPVLVVALVVAAGVWFWVNQPKTLQQADPNLYQQIIDADQALTADAQQANTLLACVTSGTDRQADGTCPTAAQPTATSTPDASTSPSETPTATPTDTTPPAPAAWMSANVPTDDPNVTAAHALITRTQTLHDWVALYTNGDVTRLTSKLASTPTDANPDFDNPAPPVAGATASGSPSATDPGATPSPASPSPASTDSPSATASETPAPDAVTGYIITPDQAKALLTALQQRHTLFGASAGMLADALTTAQITSATSLYTPALAALDQALSNANALIASSQGQVTDDSTRQALQAAVTAAQAVRDANATAPATPADIQAATDAINAATATLDAPSQAVAASQQAWQAAQAAAQAQQRSQSSSNHSGSSSSSSSHSGSSSSSSSSGGGSGSSSGSGSGSGSGGGNSAPSGSLTVTYCGPDPNGQAKMIVKSSYSTTVSFTYTIGGKSASASIGAGSTWSGWFAGQQWTDGMTCSAHVN